MNTYSFCQEGISKLARRNIPPLHPRRGFIVIIPACGKICFLNGELAWQMAFCDKAVW